ncbi:MAG: hypothetical protein KF812_11010 [Fimbriimonadaceae bacterium]|nr:hypothetical protein [Fimbriimonadaceae bacterium]
MPHMIRGELSAKISSFLLGGIVLVLTSGCQSGQLANPHDPASVDIVDAGAVLNAYNDARDRMIERVARREISRADAEKLLLDYVKNESSSIDVDLIPEDEAWEYGDLFRLAGDWTTANQLYAAAANYAKANNDTDRFVNDTLRLAWTQAQLGQVDAAIETARSTFEVPPAGRAPILFSVLYEIVPAGQGKGKDKELADLLVDASKAHMSVQVDPQSEGGKRFLASRTYHLNGARTAAIQLYQKSGHDDRARAVLDEYNQMVRGERSL